MLDRRTIVLADGSVRSYFALPLDYQDFTPPARPMDLAARFLPMGSGGPGREYGGFDRRFPPGGPMSPNEFRGVREEQFARSRPQDHWNSRGTDERGGPAEFSMKRKFNDDSEKDRKDEKDEMSRRQQQFLHNENANGFHTGSGERRGDFLAGTSDPYGRTEDIRFSKYMRVGGSYENEGLRPGSGHNVAPKYLEVDQNALRKAFLHFVKTINENATQKKNYLEDGKHGRLQCLACSRFDAIGLFLSYLFDLQYFYILLIINASLPCIRDNLWWMQLANTFHCLFALSVVIKKEVNALSICVLDRPFQLRCFSAAAFSFTTDIKHLRRVWILT